MLVCVMALIFTAHCATMDKVPLLPEILSVVLGKYHLKENDVFSEERKVFSVIIHEEFRIPQHTDNDIALLKLKTEAVYSDYVQPACLWSSDVYRKLSSNQVTGAVVGWGITEIHDRRSPSRLERASLPLISELVCIKKNPLFYGTVLRNNRKFCAGWENGTIPCNGDSGGGFTVYVPNAVGTTGAWYIRGIVSIGIAQQGVCDPNQYAVFTDTSKYEDWIQTKSNVNSCS